MEMALTVDEQHDYNSQYIRPDQGAYGRGQSHLDTGLTDADLRQKNLAHESTGKLAITGIACLVSGSITCNAEVSGLATWALPKFYRWSLRRTLGRNQRPGIEGMVRWHKFVDIVRRSLCDKDRNDHRWKTIWRSVG